jgi:hypothetical protein
MEQLAHYRSVIEAALRAYVAVPYAYGEIESKLIVSQAQDAYLIVNVGWDQGRRIHGCLVHIEIIDGHIWIQCDGTERGMALDLVEAGIPKDRIVLAFHPPERRQYTDFAHVA